MDMAQCEYNYYHLYVFTANPRCWQPSDAGNESSQPEPSRWTIQVHFWTRGKYAKLVVYYYAIMCIMYFYIDANCYHSLASPSFVIIMVSFQVRNLMSDVMTCVGRGRACLVVPKKRTIEEIMQSRNMVRSNDIVIANIERVFIRLITFGNFR